MSASASLAGLLGLCFTALTEAAAAELAAGSPPLSKDYSPPGPVPGEPDRLEISFDQLAAFDFQPPVEAGAQQEGETTRIPTEIRKLDGRLVRIRGFMFPFVLKDNRVTECMIVRSALAEDKAAAPNEWVLVRIPDPGAEIVESDPVYFYGRLHVGEMYDHGAYIGLYRLECERVSRNQ